MTLTLGIVGCGSMGRRRIRHACGWENASVIVWDIREDRRAAAMDEFSIQIAESEDSFMQNSLDAMFISVPPSEHEHYIERCLAANIPFMVEQPISHRTENLDAILEVVRQKNLVTHVSRNHRFSARIKTIQAILDRGDIGRPRTGLVEVGEWLPDWHPYEPYTDYYPSKRSMGGGIDAICDLDWMIFLFGRVARSTSLCARKSDLDIDTDDVAQFILDFEDGPQLMLHTDMLQRSYHQQVRIVGSEGTLVHNHPNAYIDIFTVSTGAWHKERFEMPEPAVGNIPGKTWQAYVEPMYQDDSLDFLGRLSRADSSTESLEAGIYTLMLTKSLIL